MLEGFLQEVRWAGENDRIFPNERSACRVLGALLTEQHEVWSAGRKWLDVDTFRNWKAARELRPVV